jgi:site-specific recombinase XerD
VAVRAYADARGRVRYAVEFEQQGRRVHRRCPPSTTQAQARELEVRLRRELFNRDALQHQPDIPLAEALQRWLDATLPHRKDQTVKNKAHQWAEFVTGKTLMDVPPVTQSALKSWKAAGLSAATVNRRLCVLKAVCKWAWEQSLIAENLSPRIRLLPGEKKREVYLTAEEIDQLASCATNTTVRSAIYLTAYTGLRASELLHLPKQLSTTATLLVAQTKSGKPRSVPVIDKIRPYLSALPIPLTYRQLIGEFWIARKAAGLDYVRWHDLRHSTASMLINSGVSLYIVGQILGHSSTQTTSRYAHLTHETLRDAMAKLDQQAPTIPPRTRLRRVK